MLIKYLAKQIYPDDSKFIEEAYVYDTGDPHGYLLLDLKQAMLEECVYVRKYSKDSVNYKSKNREKGVFFYK